MDDLYVIFLQKLAAGVTAIHPHRWLLREAHEPLSIGFMDYSIAKNPRLRRDEPIPPGPPLCINGIEITEVRDTRAALKKCGRQSRASVYLADPLVSRRYAKDLPTGVEVQNALKDCLKETFPSLKFEVSTPVGQVDCVTDDAIYEVAKLNSWKHALGQLCAYKLHLKRRKTILYLYGTVENPRALEKVTQTCSQYGIVVNYKHCSSASNSGDSFQRQGRPSPPYPLHQRLISEAHHPDVYRDPTGNSVETISQRASRASRAIGVRSFCPVGDPA